MDEAGHSNLMCGAILGAACFHRRLLVKNSMMQMQGRRGGSAPDDVDGGGAVGRPGCTDVAS